MTTAALCCLELAGVMGGTLVLSLLPVILRETGSSGAAPATAVSSAYAVGLAGFMVLGGRLGDAFGHVPAILASGAVSGAAGMLVALTDSAWTIAVGRLVQGLAAAVTVPAALALITRTVPEGAQRRRAMAAWGAVSAAGGAAGFLLGGAAAASGWWRYTFLIPALTSVTLAVAVSLLIRGRDVAAGPTPPPTLDVAGGILITSTISGTVGALSVAESLPPVGGVLLACSLVALAAFVVVERRSPNPLLQPTTLRRPAVRDGSTVAFVNTATTSSATTLLTLNLPAVGGVSTAGTALTLLPFSAGVVVGSTLAPRTLSRRGDRPCAAIGLTLVALGIGALPPAAENLVLTGAAMAVSGVGIGLSAAGATHLGTSGTGTDQAPAAALLNTAAQLGTATGIAACLALAALTGPNPVWWGLAILAVTTAALMRRRHAGAVGGRHGQTGVELAE